jgi:hypothetical protein
VSVLVRISQEELTRRTQRLVVAVPVLARRCSFDGGLGYVVGVPEMDLVVGQGGGVLAGEFAEPAAERGPQPGAGLLEDFEAVGSPQAQDEVHLFAVRESTHPLRWGAAPGVADGRRRPGVGSAAPERGGEPQVLCG